MAEPSVRECVEGSRRLELMQGGAARAIGLLGRIRVVGGAGIPTHGPIVLAMNHCSLLDGPLMCGLVERPVSCLIKSEAFVPGLGRLLHEAGQISVARDAIDPAPVRRCLEILWAGGVVGIFPEGTRGDGSARLARPGVGYLALRTGATVIPVAGHGTARLGRTLGRAQVLVAVGEPMRFAVHARNSPLNRRRSAEVTEVIRARLAALVATTTPHGASAAARLDR
jgi:1-acyl-sn-glycerol-3-phosphate acyltransferase